MDRNLIVHTLCHQDKSGPIFLYHHNTIENSGLGVFLNKTAHTSCLI